jgi:hypothetical protein
LEEVDRELYDRRGGASGSSCYQQRSNRAQEAFAPGTACLILTKEVEPKTEDENPEMPINPAAKTAEAEQLDLIVSWSAEFGYVRPA